jgi:hypothetical protein
MEHLIFMSIFTLVNTSSHSRLLMNQVLDSPHTVMFVSGLFGMSDIKVSRFFNRITQKEIVLRLEGPCFYQNGMGGYLSGHSLGAQAWGE